MIGKTCAALANLSPRPVMGIESCGMLLSAIRKENGEERLNLLQLDPHIPAGAKLYSIITAQHLGEIRGVLICR